MPLISNIYLILLLPLLVAFSCAIVKNKSINHLLIVVVIATILVWLFKISPIFIQGKYVYSNIFAVDYSLLLNYNFNIVGLSFAIIILSQKLTSLLFFKEQIGPKVTNNNATFYSASLVNIFSILLILTSSNFVNLFLAIEIYSMSLMISKNAISNKEQKKMIISNIFIHNVSLIIFVCCLLFLYISFGSFDFNIIKQAISGDGIAKYSVLLILVLLVISVCLRFLQFWSCFRNIKARSAIQQYISFQDLFTNTIIGIYLLIKLANIFYIDSHLLQDLNLDKYLIILVLFSSIYFAVDSLRQKNLRSLSIYYCIHHVNLILLAILINNQSSFVSLFYYLVSMSLSVFTIYLISVIIENYIFSGIVNLRSDKKKGAIVICNVITVALFILAISPISILFFGNFYLIKSALLHPLYFLIIPVILVICISFFVTTLNARADLLKKILKEKILKKILKKSQINLSFFNYSFYLLIIGTLIGLNILFIYYSHQISGIFLEMSKFILVNQI